MRIIHGIAILCLLVMMGQVKAQGVDVSVSVTSLIPWATVITDPDWMLAVDDMLERPIKSERQRESTTMSYTYSDDAKWLLVDLNNPTSVTVSRLLVFEPTWLDKVDVYLLGPDGTLLSQSGGDFLPYMSRSIDNRKINFELDFLPGGSRLVVRVQTTDPFQVSMALYDREAFFESFKSEGLFLGLLYGGILAMLLYNLLLYVSLREPVYAAYVLYLLAFVVMHANYNGHTYVIWPDSPQWQNWTHSIFIYLFIASGINFAINFLELRTKQAQAYRWSKILAIVVAVSFVVTAMVDGYSLHVRSSIIWALVYAPFILGLGISAMRAGNRAARFFLTAAVAGFIGSAITAATVSGFVPYSVLGYHAIDIGMLLDAILLSFALADRLRIARAETWKAKAELLEKTQSYAKDLEETVVARTSELQYANATKDKFFSIIAHDLRAPIGGLNTLFNDIVAKKEDLTDEALLEARRATKNTNEFLEQLLIWARSQQGALVVSPEPVDIGRMLKDMQSLFEVPARAKKISLDLDVYHAYWVYCDIRMLHAVLRNLINNAIKFTGKGGKVFAQVIDDGDHYLIRIIDTGIGVSEASQQELFRLDAKTHSTKGTAGETGTGLGLLLCAEFVEKNGGAIGVMSKYGKGATFWFTLPRYRENGEGN